MQPVSDETLKSMREEAEKQLAEPESEDPYIANYDYPAMVPSRELLAVLDELEHYRRRIT